MSGTVVKNRSSRPVRWRSALSGVAAVVLSVGCGGSDRPETVAVTGKVTVNGQPVEGASVEFHPAEDAGGRHAHGVTKSDGTFELTTFDEGDGAVPGNYDVAISKKAVKQGIDVKNMTPSGANSPGAQAYEQMMIRRSDNPVADTGTIPEKYSDPKTSELRRTVDASGGNEFNFDL